MTPTPTPWALLRLPGQEALLFRGPLSAWPGSEGFAFCGFDAPDVFINAEAETYPLAGLAGLHMALPPPRALPPLPAFRETVHTVLGEIAAGKYQKIVLSRYKVVPLGQVEPEALFAVLCSAYPHAAVYVAHLPGAGTWCAASPELLLEKTPTHVRSCSLAGTSSTATFREKELREQQIVTRYLEDTFAEMGLAPQVGQVEKIQSGQLFHLRQQVVARLRTSEANGLELAKAIHPTPAVGGYPVRAVKGRHLGLEGYGRDYYAGFFGHFRQNTANLYVNLRCARLWQGQAQLFAGAGIVEGSEPEEEFMETERKMEAVCSVLATIVQQTQ